MFQNSCLECIPGESTGMHSFPVLFNIYSKHIMLQSLNDYNTSISVDGLPQSNLWFSDDINPMARTDSELQDLTTRLQTVSRSHGMEIYIEKKKDTGEWLKMCVFFTQMRIFFTQMCIYFTQMFIFNGSKNA